MPNIRVSDILDFKADSAKVPPNELYPVLSYLKIEFKINYCNITKHGFESFVSKNIHCECNGEPTILVDELKLYDIAQGSKTDYVSIESVKDKIILTSGKLKAITATEELAKFPVNDVLPLEWKPISVDAITAIGIAKSIVISDEDTKHPATMNVFSNDKYVVACNGAISFYKPLYEVVPKMVLRKDICLAISSMPGADFTENDSYYFFKTGSILFGFSKSQTMFYDISHFGKLESDKLSFSANKEEIIKFNNICANSSKSKVITAKFNCKSPTELELIFIDPDSGYDEVVDSIDIINGFGSFKYDPKVMNELLRAVPATECYFYEGKNKYYITDEQKSFISLIMGVI
jgi:hypothetical protein